MPHPRAGGANLHGAEQEAARAAGDPEGLWRATEAAARQWLARRLGRTATPGRVVACARRRTDRPQTTGRGGEARQRAADAALLRLRQLRSYGHAAGAQWWAGPGCLPHPAQRILAALDRGAADDAEWAGALAGLRRGPGEVLPGLVARAEGEYAAASAAARTERRLLWQRWVDNALVDGSGRIYRWIKGGRTSAAALVPDPAAREPGQGGEAATGSRRWLLAMRGGPCRAAPVLGGALGPGVAEAAPCAPPRGVALGAGRPAAIPRTHPLDSGAGAQPPAPHGEAQGGGLGWVVSRRASPPP